LPCVNYCANTSHYQWTYREERGKKASGLAFAAEGRTELFSSRMSRRLKTNNRDSLKILFLFTGAEEPTQPDLQYGARHCAT